jgi:hypothetical protein
MVRRTQMGGKAWGIKQIGVLRRKTAGFGAPHGQVFLKKGAGLHGNVNFGFFSCKLKGL